MLKNFATWFIVFGLSILVSNVFGWTEQGRIFLFICLTRPLVVVLVHAARNAKVTNTFFFLMILASVVSLAITLFTTWVAAKLFGVDFFVSFQIMTFGQCLCPTTIKKYD